MDISKIYYKALENGNKEIIYLVSRSLFCDVKGRTITIDLKRLSNELRLYKYSNNKGFASLISALVPVIITNGNIENAFREGSKLIEFIRKKITLENKMGLSFLCNYIYNLDNTSEAFSSFKMIDSTKEEEVAFQKEKISIILKKATLDEKIVELLEEKEIEKNINLLKSFIEENFSIGDESAEKMANYLRKLSEFKVSPKSLSGNFDINAIAMKKPNEAGIDYLLGEYKVLSNDRNTGKILIESKRGVVDITFLSENLSYINNELDDNEMVKKTNTMESIESGNDYFTKFRINELDEKWQTVVKNEMEKDYFKNLLLEIDLLYGQKIVYPKQTEVFRALREVAFDDVKVIIIGQDPYHGEFQANGLCFSVNRGVKAPPSLVNIFKELEIEYGEKRTDVDLMDWARQGVLLLNSVLTVEGGQAASHSKRGWEKFTDAIIEELNKKNDKLVFILWGNYAIEKAKNVDMKKHLVLKSNHPSPLSASRGFFGNNHFLSADKFLEQNGKTKINWITKGKYGDK